MSMSCQRCGGPVDPLREPARVTGGRVVSICRPCVGQELEATPAGRLAHCFVCEKDVEAFRAVPIVTGGLVRLRCPACTPRAQTVDDLGGELTPAPVAREPIPHRHGAWTYFAGGAALLAMSCAAWISQPATSVSPWRWMATAQAHGAPEQEEVDDGEIRAVPRETQALPITADSIAGSIVITSTAEGRAAPFPSAPRIDAAVVHPLALGYGVMPATDGGRFGADRDGDRPEECGAGHCGIDLRAAEGTLVVAVRDGSVVTARAAGDARGGHFVKLAHDDGTATYYFHLDRLRPDLVAGTRVTAGQPIATLGRTGVQFSPTHLHFAMTVRDESGRERYVDPLPLVVGATVAPAPALLAAE
jgi:murein DD-endopeptidase MepM/ murein hydrolase activator NlpD